MDLSVFDLEEKYKLFFVDCSEYTEEDVGNQILKNISCLDKDKSYCMSCINKDIWRKRAAQIRNFLGIGFCEEFLISLYDRRQEIFEEEIELIRQYEYYFNDMLSILDSNNFQEILKLYDFTENYYCYNFDFLEAQLDQVEQESRGISYIDNRTFDTRKTFDEFFYSQLAFIVSMEGKEKVKKL